MSKSSEATELIVRGVLNDAGRVLLCRSVKVGYWYLPGGHVEFAESASAALEREFIEETGLAIVVRDLVLVTEEVFGTKRRGHHELNLVFHVERGVGDASAVTSREPRIAFEWVEAAAIIDLDIRPATVKAWLMTRSDVEPRHTEWVSGITNRPPE